MGTSAFIDNVGSDKNFTQAFTALATVHVNHNLNKKPAISIIDSALDEVEGSVNYVDNNNITVTFSSAFTGTVICN